MKTDIYSELLGKLADCIERHAVLIVEDYHAIATGKLHGGIHVRLEGVDSGNPQIICYAEGDSAAYARYVHEGRAPGKMPPISPLILWAKKKEEKGGGALFPEIGSGLVHRTRFKRLKSGNLSINKKDVSAFKTAEKIAWALVKSIEKEGIPAKEYFLEALEKAIEEWS
ncbi:MAG: hypothetical protein PHC50_08315 [Candidatus Cloacimonetes bacterium]|nr:hypothetical protein [Candidatus Cloacimonadota bacterium]